MHSQSLPSRRYGGRGLSRYHILWCSGQHVELVEKKERAISSWQNVSSAFDPSHLRYNHVEQQCKHLGEPVGNKYLAQRYHNICCRQCRESNLQLSSPKLAQMYFSPRELTPIAQVKGRNTYHYFIEDSVQWTPVEEGCGFKSHMSVIRWLGYCILVKPSFCVAWQTRS